MVQCLNPDGDKVFYLLKIRRGDPPDRLYKRVPGLFPEVKRLGQTFTNHHILRRWLRMNVAILLHPVCALMPCYGKTFTFTNKLDVIEG